MRWTQKLSENIKRSVRSWLNVTPAQPYAIQIQEVMDFELTAIRNRIWYRGDSNELEQMYMQNPEFTDKHKFWASKCTPGMEMRKIHTGMPGLIVRTLSSVVLSDMSDFEFPDSDTQKQVWENIAKENDFQKKIEGALKEALYIGDGAFKISIDTELSEYPIIEWVPGEKIEIIRRYGRVQEVVFKTACKANGRQYVLNERYGYGYIKNELYLDEQQVELSAIPYTAGLKDWTFDKSVILAVPLQIYESNKYEGRGGSIFDGKLDSFDALDEAWSQWMQALRVARARVYVPESFIPHDPDNGKLTLPNPFDNQFIASNDNMSENGKNQIETVQPDIPHESYSATYCTALDLCLQGIISPSTLGIDVKKLDNAEAQREKEKTTLYTRDAIIGALQNILPKLVEAAINANNLIHKLSLEEVKVDIPFGEYANPSFESQVETIGKGKTQGIMSIEAAVEELYGDSRDDGWKAEEIARLKAELGVAELEEPGINLGAGGFKVNVGGAENAGSDRKKNMGDEPEGVSGTSGSGE